MAKTVKCPCWGCNGVGIPVDTKKKFSVGKSITGGLIGTAVGGPIGGAIGSTMNGIKGKNGKQSLFAPSVGKCLRRKYNKTKYWQEESERVPLFDKIHNIYCYCRKPFIHMVEYRKYEGGI